MFLTLRDEKDDKVSEADALTYARSYEKLRDNKPPDNVNRSIGSGGDAPGRPVLIVDVFALGIKHVHGGHGKVFGIHDHFSGLNWVKLIGDESAETIAECLREFHPAPTHPPTRTYVRALSRRRLV